MTTVSYHPHRDAHAASAVAQPGTPPPAMRLRELVFGAACAAAVRAAARLGVADALGDAPATAEELAAAVHAEPQPLRRLLRALSCYGIFAETEDGTFAHTEMSRLLREDDPHSLRYIALWCTEPWTWEVWPRLDDAVRSGIERLPGPLRQGVLRVPAPGRPRVGPGVQPGHDHLQHAVGTGRRRTARPHRRLGGRGHRRRPGPCAGEPAGEAPGRSGEPCSTCPVWWPRRTPGCATAGRSPTGPRSWPATAVRASRSRPTSTSSRTSSNGTTTAPAGPCATSSAPARPGARVVDHREPRRRHPLHAVHHGHGPAAAAQRGRRQAHQGEPDRPDEPRPDLVVGEIRPVNTYLHAFECTVPARKA